MKIVNDKGKLFGLINVVDLIIVIAVVLVVGAIIWQLVGNQVNEVVSNKVEVKAELVVEDVTPEFVEEVIRQDLIGQRLVSGSAYLAAKISDIWVEDRQVIIQNEGNLIEVIDPSNKNIHFNITTAVADTASFKIGVQELKLGKTIILKTQTFESDAKILAIDVIDRE